MVLNNVRKYISILLIICISFLNNNINYCKSTLRQQKTKMQINKRKDKKNEDSFRFSTKKKVIFKNDNVYCRTQQLEYKNNKVICKGESVCWVDNLQASGEKIEIQMEEGYIKTITITEKALIVLFDSTHFPNHMTAKKIIFTFQNKNKKMEIKNITLYNNVNILYAILQNDKISMIGKGQYNELRLYINPKTKQWDAKIDVPAGNLMSPEYVKNNWEKIKLQNFKIFKK